MSDALDDLVYGFHARLKELSEHNPELFHELTDFDPEAGVFDDAITLGRRAADMVVAPGIWRGAIGKVYDTSVLAELLGVTRQAIAQRVNAHTLLAVPGRRTRYYPVWQIRQARQVEVSDAVPDLLRCWLEIEPEVESLTIATWANTASEHLDGRRPWEVLLDGRPEAMIEAAKAAAYQRTR